MYALDLSILYFFNRTIASPFLDGFFDALTNVHYWYPVYAVAGIYLIFRFRWQGVWMVVLAVLVVAATDSLGHYVFKPLMHRSRPCAISPSFSRRGQGVVNGEHIVNWIRLPDGPRGDESFPSNHALNNFAIAAFFFTIWKRKRNVAWLFAGALLISLGRVYEGLHYPSDVLGGAVIGISMGILFAIFFKLLEKRFKH
jgi:undecaprenyl-diphosphatase